MKTISSTWVSAPLSEKRIWLSVDLVTRRITFCYQLDSEGGTYRFPLISECRDDIQEILIKGLADNKIEILKVQDCLDYYSIVTNSESLVFER